MKKTALQRERRGFKYESFETELDSYFNNLQRHWRKKEMHQGNSKSKGNKYELTISRILTKWYDSKTEKDLFWRTSGSGARSTRGKSPDTAFVGDITFLPKPYDIKVWIDCKDRKDVTFNDLLSQDKKPILLKWYETEEEKRDTLMLFDLKILIIFKLYRKKENYVFFYNDDFIDVALTPSHIGRPDKAVKWNGFSITRLDNFLKEVKKKEIVK